MIVIVEGIDRVGKSTFCKLLTEYGYKILDSKIHTQKTDVDSVVYDRLQEERTVAQAQLLSLLDTSEKIVIDRFHLSQYIYGFIDRQRDTSLHMMDLENLLLHNTVLVYIMPTNIYISSQQHGSDLIEHHRLFEEAFNMSKLKKYKGSYYDLDKLLHIILEADNGN